MDWQHFRISGMAGDIEMNKQCSLVIKFLLDIQNNCHKTFTFYQKKSSIFTHITCKYYNTNSHPFLACNYVPQFPKAYQHKGLDKWMQTGSPTPDILKAVNDILYIQCCTL